MIIIEVEVPVMGTKYDFQIDENVPVCEVKEEVAELICQKEQCTLRGDLHRMLVWTQDGRELRQELTAHENRLRTGARIMLV
ncbi:MAG: hypothetical protein K1W22_15290 [Lachnospiraceae bacterium]